MINDFRYALRALSKSPSFVLICVATLALGIGANTAIFSVVDAILLRPLPFKDPGRIVALWANSSNSSHDVFSFPDYAALREQSRSFSAIACYTRTGGTLSREEDSQFLDGVSTTPELFAVLGIPPFLGRGFTAEEFGESGPRVIVLTHQFWRRAFGGDPKILGQQIKLSGRMHTVIGVMPPDWKFPVEDERIDYVVPAGYQGAANLNNRSAQFLSITGRLQPGVTARQAQSEISGIMARLAQQFPETNTNRAAAIVRSLHSDVTGGVRPALVILLGAVALVLLIACANVANLLLARSAARSREIAIRTALGASRAQIVRQLLCESFLLAFLGGSAGLLFAWWGLDLLNSLGPIGLPHLGQIQVNGPVCLFTLTVALGSTLLFGLIPALQISRPEVNSVLQQGGKGTAGGLQTSRTRAVLVVSQVSLSLLLLTAAGLLIKSFFNLRASDPGFDPERVVTSSLTLPRVRYSESEQQIRAHDRVLQKLAAIPGVEAAAGISTLPLSGNVRTRTFMVSGAVPKPRGSHPEELYYSVTPNYFRVMRIPLLAGRDFTFSDSANSAPVVVINEAFAQRFFSGRDPLGERVLIDVEENRVVPYEVVGVVGGSKHRSLSEQSLPQFYCPFGQNPNRTLNYVLRTAVPNLAGLDATMKRAVREVDKELFAPAPEAMSVLVGNQLAQPRFNMALLAVFAAVAMLLAAIGIYGVIAYSVAQRTREIGIRMALGAQRTQMLQMILRQSLTLVAAGLGIGFLIALAATRLMRTLLYGVGANDFSTYGIVVLLLGGAALMASYLPARRAMKVDPIIALRYE